MFYFELAQANPSGWLVLLNKYHNPTYGWVVRNNKVRVGDATCNN